MNEKCAIGFVGDSILWNQKPLTVRSFKGFYREYPLNIDCYTGSDRWEYWINPLLNVSCKINALPGRKLSDLTDKCVVRDLVLTLYPYTYLVLALGTNDLQAKHNTCGCKLYHTLFSVFSMIQILFPNTHVLYLSPPGIDEEATGRHGLWDYTGFTEKMKVFEGCINAGELITNPHFSYLSTQDIVPAGIDGVHFTPENNKSLGMILHHIIMNK